MRQAAEKNETQAYSATFDEMMAEVRKSYSDFRALPDGRLIGVHRLLFHWTLHIDIDLVGYGDRYCYGTYEQAKQAFDEWDGTGDPGQWHRHPKSGRRRDPVTGRVWLEP